jgi:hypothetical protein
MMQERDRQRNLKTLIELLDLAKRQFSLERGFAFLDPQSHQTFYIFKHKRPFATLNITPPEFVNAVLPLLVYPEIRSFLAPEILQYGLTNNFVLPNKDKHFSLRTKLVKLETTIQEYKALPSLGIPSLNSWSTNSNFFQANNGNLNLWLIKLQTLEQQRDAVMRETLKNAPLKKTCDAYVLWLARTQNLGILSAQLYANARRLNIKVHAPISNNSSLLKNKINDGLLINLFFYDNQMTLLYESTLTYLPLLWQIAKSSYAHNQNENQVAYSMNQLNNIIQKQNTDFFSLLTDKIIRRVIDYIIPIKDIANKTAYNDLSNFGQTNKRLSEITQDQDLWKVLFLKFVNTIYGYEFINEENAISLSNTTKKNIMELLRDELLPSTAATYANKSKIHELNAYFPMKASTLFFQEEQNDNPSNYVDNFEQIIEHVILAINNGNLSAWFLFYEICKFKQNHKNINDVVRIIQTVIDNFSQNRNTKIINDLWEDFIVCKSYEDLLKKIKINCTGILCNQSIDSIDNRILANTYQIADLHFEKWHFLQSNFKQIKSFFIHFCQIYGDIWLSENAISYLINSFNPYLIVNELLFSDINTIALTAHGEVIINFLSSITNQQQRKLATNEYLTLCRQGYFINDRMSQLFDIQRLNAILKSDNRDLLLNFSISQLNILNDVLINFYSIEARALLQKFKPSEITSIFEQEPTFHTGNRPDDDSFVKSKLLTLNITTPLLDLLDVGVLRTLSTFDLSSLIIDDKLQTFLRTYPYCLKNFHEFDLDKLRLIADNTDSIPKAKQSYQKSFNPDKKLMPASTFFTKPNVDDRTSKRQKLSDETNASERTTNALNNSN